MKTCFVCSKSYNYICPIYSYEYIFNENNFEILSKNKRHNYCSVACLKQHSINISAYFPDNHAFTAHIPVPLSMCQFCGCFTHPSEFCLITEYEKEYRNNVEKVGNKTGEWCRLKGELQLIILGKNICLETIKVLYTAEMVKLDPERINDRLPLVYFWFSNDSCQMVLDELKLDNQMIELQKDFIIQATPVKSKQPRDQVSQMVIQVASKIIDDNKLFFPYEIREPNCWWPSTEEFLVLREKCTISPQYPIDSDIISYDLSNILEYEKEEFHPQVNENMENLTVEMNHLTIPGEEEEKTDVYQVD